MKTIEDSSYKKIFLLLLVIRLALLLITPGSLLTDGYAIYTPSIDTLFDGSLNFWYPPLYIFIAAPFYYLLSLDLFVVVMQIFSIIFSVFGLWQIKLFLEKNKVAVNHIKFTLLVSGLLTWSLLTSVSFHSDALFFAIFAYGLNVVWEFSHVKQVDTKMKSWEIAFKIVIIIFALLISKPLAWFAIGSYGLLYLSLEVKKLNTRTLGKSFLEFGSLAIIGVLLFSPWLVKNQNDYGTFYLSASDDEYAGALELIDPVEIPSQIEKVSAFFWEYPDRVRTGNFMEDISNQTIKQLAAFYYIGNITVFALLATLILLGTIRALRQKDRTYISFLAILLPVISFAVFYWPFFGKYNYWDAGRYSVIVMPFLITIALLALQKARQVKVYALFIFVILFSITNAFIVSGYINLKETSARDILKEIKVDSGIVTNDNFFKIIGEFKTGDGILLSEVDDGESIYRNDRYVLLKRSSEYFVKSFNPSRNF